MKNKLSIARRISVRKQVLIIMLLLTVSSVKLMSQQINIKVENIRNRTGQLCIGFFSSESDFLKEKACHTIIVNKSDLSGDSCSVCIPFKPGTFGISVLDDENSDGKMNYKVIGIPCEGFGFSNFPITTLKKPVFSDFEFKLNEGETKNVKIIMKYLF
jgi:uncharacterized protein (DUF2141 family)